MTDNPSVYLNHAGTSWPKPPAVHEAVQHFWQMDPMDWGKQFQADHQAIANFFGIPSTSQLLLTPACTAALAIAVFDHFWNPGDRVLTTAFEHHALHRPLVKLVDQGVEVELIPHLPHELILLEALESSLRAGGVKLVAITAASNVSGDLTPFREVVKLAHQYEARVLIDAAQVAGWLELDFPDIGADLVAFAGHKGLQGPWGIGGLYLAEGLKMNSPAAVCELTYDKSTGKPKPATEGPGWCDSGSVPRPPLSGLAAATKWLEAPERKHRLTTARVLSQRLFDCVADLPNSVMYSSPDPNERLPTVAFNFQQVDSVLVAESLSQNHIVCSGGMQCAPLAHKTFDTAPHGIVRLSVGPQTTEEDIDRAIIALQDTALTLN